MQKFCTQNTDAIGTFSMKRVVLRVYSEMLFFSYLDDSTLLENAVWFNARKKVTLTDLADSMKIALFLGGIITTVPDSEDTK